MARIKPLQAIYYSRKRIPSLAEVVAPPYDVIDEQARERLADRSPYNIVAIDLPRTPPDPYAAAAQLFATWLRDGVLERDRQEALWAYEQEFLGPDGRWHRRRGFFAGIQLEGYGPGRIRPHERTHPGPRQDRLRLTRATRANLSPIFALYSDPEGTVFRPLERLLPELPFAEVQDDEGNYHRLWRTAEPTLIATVLAAFGQRELLIADGHHRYETSLTYARESGGLEVEGPHRYCLACLVALQDPGLAVFPIHRLVALDPAQARRLEEFLARKCAVEELPLPQLRDRCALPGSGFSFGVLDGSGGPPRWASWQAGAPLPPTLAERSPAYRELDTALLEELVLKGTLGFGQDQIERLEHFGYARTVGEAQRLLSSGKYTHAFLLRPTPVARVAAVAQAGEFMPQKSTYFYPKLLTGLLINPLW